MPVQTASAAAKNPRLQLCKRHVPRQTLRRDIVSRLHRSWADDLCSPRACLVQFADLVLVRQSGVLVNSDPCSWQICLCGQSCRLLRMRLTERSPKRNADVRHDGLVQINTRPLPCLCRIAHLSNPNAQASEARGEFRSLPSQLRDSASKEHRKRLPEPTFQASLHQGHYCRWDQPEIIIQGACNSVAPTSTPSQS